MPEGHLGDADKHALDGPSISPYQAAQVSRGTCLEGPCLKESLVSSAASNRRAIIAMITAMALFTGNDTLTKLATANMPPGQIMGIRGIFAVLLTAGIVIGMGETRHLRELKSPLLAGRALLEATVAFTFLTAL